MADIAYLCGIMGLLGRHNSDIESLRRKSRTFRAALAAAGGALLVAAFIIRGVSSCSHENLDCDRMENSPAPAASSEPVTEAPGLADNTAVQDTAKTTPIDECEGVEEPPEPDYSRYNYYVIEDMVCRVAHEGYFASVYHVGGDTWMMLYESGGNEYLRQFNPAERTYGKTMKLVLDDFNEYHLATDRNMTYSVAYSHIICRYRGKVKEVWPTHGIPPIDIDTPDDLEDEAEDIYYDEEEDLYLYYGR